ncbi:hypothetical protein AAZX31_03G114100 [Glycine max]|uniref:Strictosidine synthase conserved region domain-containing protein n=2 Tax=Glycine subgen. Soja TaxID=1462606 RepID=I1JN76_SOYBN|nr:protein STRICTOSIDINE SYNTHASE-LIKE 2 [Glycine max]XP_028225225.1 protein STRICTOSIDINE SYNTHASE-LIKE 2-like [Glycine soja]KAG5043282.1 hypothetical protein JHK87_007197 [Glycine soja]KAH1069764.1 hypothetical protein GYH30_007091 [Glycine max]KRH66810.1 hypothetical protein GLYMA_03G130200v4 [Glycine max]RZC20434.1 Protein STRICTOSIDINE SYNTHASE-LIKE 2 [Glycine soja]|eukprot:XP_003521147.1 protein STRICTOSIDINE SYNTHASE-LIKE 2 [Glycine max]
MRRQQLHFAAVVAAIVVTAWVAHMRGGVGQSEAKGWQFEAVPIDGAVGPESFSFDPRGEGPYTGVSDGRIIKWHQTQNRWLNFSAIASSSHWDEECGGPCDEHSKKEHVCGRPLGLCFSTLSNDLYIADSYKGLVVVGPHGGTTRRLVSTIEGEPLAFTNGLDVDQRTGAVYFTSSSSKYPRRNYMSLILSRDKTGMLMKYEPQSEQVSVLLKNLSYANGVALSKDGEYILIIETTTCRVLRYWLETPKTGTLEVFADLPGFPDNIKRSPRGGFWVGIYSRREKIIQWILSYPWIGKVLLRLPLDIPKAYSYLAKLKRSNGMAIRLSEQGDILEIVNEKNGSIGRSISEVEERDGILWVGSIDAPFVGKYNIHVVEGQVKRI